MLVDPLTHTELGTEGSSDKEVNKYTSFISAHGLRLSSRISPDPTLVLDT
jgi:hypothetical protein